MGCARLEPQLSRDGGIAEDEISSLFNAFFDRGFKP